MSGVLKDAEQERREAIRKIRETMLEHGLKIYCFFTEDDDLSYTMVFGGGQDVPPNLLATLLVWGVHEMKAISQPKVAEEVERADGSTVVYDHIVWFDFNTGRIFHSLEDEDMMKSVVSCVVTGLHDVAFAEAKEQAEMN